MTTKKRAAGKGEQATAHKAETPETAAQRFYERTHIDPRGDGIILAARACYGWTLATTQRADKLQQWLNKARSLHPELLKIIPDVTPPGDILRVPYVRALSALSTFENELDDLEDCLDAVGTPTSGGRPPYPPAHAFVLTLLLFWPLAGRPALGPTPLFLAAQASGVKSTKRGDPKDPVDAWAHLAKSGAKSLVSLNWAENRPDTQYLRYLIRTLGPAHDDVLKAMLEPGFRARLPAKYLS